MSDASKPTSVPLEEEDEWKLTFEYVPPHPMCCHRCKALREAVDAYLASQETVGHVQFSGLLGAVEEAFRGL